MFAMNITAQQLVVKRWGLKFLLFSKLLPFFSLSFFLHFHITMLGLLKAATCVFCTSDDSHVKKEVKSLVLVWEFCKTMTPKISYPHYTHPLKHSLMIWRTPASYYGARLSFSGRRCQMNSVFSDLKNVKVKSWVVKMPLGVELCSKTSDLSVNNDKSCEDIGARRSDRNVTLHICAIRLGLVKYVFKKNTLL